MSTTSSAEDRKSISVYIHIPYCLAKCPYCDFNSYGIDPQRPSSRTAPLQEQEYTEAILAELRYYADLPSLERCSIRSVFFGGGTPTLFSADSLAAMLQAVLAHFPPAEDCEISIEANPGTVCETLHLEKLAALRAAGINRISLGAQSFQTGKLAKLGRWHSPDDTRQSVAQLRAAGFDNYNIDLMFGVPGESTTDWQADLAAAVALQPTHIAAYGLTIEPGTEFAVQTRKGILTPPDEDLQAVMYQTTQRYLESSGYEQYEISNFAKPGFQCRHNLSYWRWQEYLGLGAGAHSFLLSSDERHHAKRWSNIPKPTHYIQRAIERGDCSQLREEITTEQAQQEYLMCALRTAAGLQLDDFTQKFAVDFEQSYKSSIKELMQRELIERKQDCYCLTTRGYLFADEVLGEMLCLT